MLLISVSFFFVWEASSKREYESASLAATWSKVLPLRFDLLLCFDVLPHRGCLHGLIMDKPEWERRSWLSSFAEEKGYIPAMNSPPLVLGEEAVGCPRMAYSSFTRFLARAALSLAPWGQQWIWISHWVSNRSCQYFLYRSQVHNKVNRQFVFFCFEPKWQQNR